MVAWVTGVIIANIALFNILCYVLNENNWVWKCLCCCAQKGPLVISQRSRGVARALRPQQRLAWDLVDANHLVRGTGAKASMHTDMHSTCCSCASACTHLFLSWPLVPSLLPRKLLWCHPDTNSVELTHCAAGCPPPPPSRPSHCSTLASLAHPAWCCTACSALPCLCSRWCMRVCSMDPPPSSLPCSPTGHMCCGGSPPSTAQRSQPR